MTAHVTMWRGKYIARLQVECDKHWSSAQSCVGCYHHVDGGCRLVDREERAPGAPDAVADGCTCLMEDNVSGRGVFGDGLKHGWVVSNDCPMHAHEPVWA